MGSILSASYEVLHLKLQQPYNSASIFSSYFTNEGADGAGLWAAQGHIAGAAAKI